MAAPYYILIPCISSRKWSSGGVVHWQQHQFGQPPEPFWLPCSRHSVLKLVFSGSMKDCLLHKIGVLLLPTRVFMILLELKEMSFNVTILYLSTISLVLKISTYGYFCQRMFEMIGFRRLQRLTVYHTQCYFEFSIQVCNMCTFYHLEGNTGDEICSHSFRYIGLSCCSMYFFYLNNATLADFCLWPLLKTLLHSFCILGIHFSHL